MTVAFRGFHGTAVGNVPTILREGLKPGGAVVAYPASSRRDVVYLTTSPDAAQSFAEGAGRNIFGRASPKSRPVLLELATPPIDLEEDENYLGRGDCFCYRGAVPPSWFTAAYVLSPKGWVRRELPAPLEMAA